MATQARAWVERHKAEGLRSGCVDYLPDINADPIAHNRHLIGEADVDEAERILKQLDHFGDAGGTDGHDGFEYLRIEEGTQLGAFLSYASNHFWNIRGL